MKAKLLLVKNSDASHTTIKPRRLNLPTEFQVFHAYMAKRFREEPLTTIAVLMRDYDYKDNTSVIRILHEYFTREEWDAIYEVKRQAASQRTDEEWQEEARKRYADYPPRHWITLPEAGYLIGVTSIGLAEMVRQGRFPGTKERANQKFYKVDFFEFVAYLREHGYPESLIDEISTEAREFMSMPPFFARSGTEHVGSFARGKQGNVLAHPRKQRKQESPEPST